MKTDREIFEEGDPEAILALFEKRITDLTRENEAMLKQGIAFSEEHGRATRNFDRVATPERVMLLVTEIKRLRALAYPETQFRHDDDGGSLICKTCNHSVDVDYGEEHTFRDNCIPNNAATDDYVHDYQVEEHDRVCKLLDKLQDAFRRWQRKDLDTEEFEGLFHELEVPH